MRSRWAHRILSWLGSTEGYFQCGFFKVMPLGGFCAIFSLSVVLAGGQLAFAKSHCADLMVQSPQWEYELREVTSAREAMDRALSYIKSRGRPHDHVLVRTISFDRLDHLLKYGTDRDDTSPTYDIPLADASPESRRKNAISPKMITFAHMVTVKQPMRTVPLSFPSVLFGPKLEAFDQIPLNCFAIAIYDPSEVSRVSEVEYWFHKDPRQSLIAIYFKKCD